MLIRLFYVGLSVVSYFKDSVVPIVGRIMSKATNKVYLVFIKVISSSISMMMLEVYI